MSKAKQFLEEVGISEAPAKNAEVDRDDEIEALFADENPRFEDLYAKIQAFIERKPMAKRAEMHKQFTQDLVSGIIGPSMINNQLVKGARNFLKLLRSGQFGKK